MDGAPFFYDTLLSPLGESKFEDGEEDFTYNASFLPLESAGSPRGQDSVAEQATSTVTVERHETKLSRTENSSAEGRGLQTLIAAEKDLLAAASTPEFRARADTSGSGDLGVVSSKSTFSVSRGRIQSMGSAGVEENVEEAEFISLEVGDGEDVETAVEDVLQSNGKRVESPVDGDGAPKEAPPWARGRESWIASPLLQLHQEIVDFCEFVAPTEEEQAVRAVAVQRVSDVVKSIWPSCQVKVFGSFATGLYLPTSDVDVVVLESGCQAIQDGLKALAKALTRGHVGKSIQVIGKARVPIIKFVETTSNIPFDISFDVANGPEAADFIKSAMGAIPPLRPLCLVLKIFLQQRELNEVYQGGIGSYALLVMILTHLQMHPSKRRASSRGQVPPLETNLGILLVDFLDLYGRTLNMRDVGVSCRGGGRFFCKRDRGFNDSKRPFLLCVEDPQSPDNDIGKNSYAIQKVRSAFMMAYRLLTSLDGDNEVGLLSRIVRMDAKLVGRKTPLSVTSTPASVAARRARPAGYYHEPKAEAEEEERYVVGDGTFSNSDSDEAMKFKTPVRGRRGRWQDYEEDDFPRGESADGYLSKKAKRAKKYKERVEDKGSPLSQFGYDRQKKSSLTAQESGGDYSRKRHGEESDGMPRYDREWCSQKSSKNGNVAESSGLEEGEVRPSRRGRRREELLKWKAEKVDRAREENRSDGAVNGEASAEGEESVGRGKRHNEHTPREDDVLGSSSRSSKKYSRLKDRASWKRDSREGWNGITGELTRRIVVTKPAHKKIKYL